MELGDVGRFVAAPLGGGHRGLPRRPGAVATNLTVGPTDLLWRGRYVHDGLLTRPRAEERGMRSRLPAMRPPIEPARVEEIEYLDDLPPSPRV